MTDNSFSVPDWLLADAKQFFSSGRLPAAPKTAATVLLLRPSAVSFEVYTIRRAATMAFASGMYAFPGGSVDPRDAAQPVEMAGPAAADWAQWFGCDNAAAHAIVCAAVREVFEECGVLLAGPSSDAVVGDVSGDDWEAQRDALVRRELGFAELLRERGLILRGDLITPWSRWLTPVFEPRRFDTYFFLARLPDGQRTRDVGGEADLVRWLRPADAISERLPMLPPTAVTLGQLGGYGSLDDALAAANHDLTSPLVPRLELTDDGGGRLSLG